MKYPKSIRLVDSTTGDERQFVNHLLKMEAAAAFTVDCAFCHNKRVLPCETHIQHGIFEDKFYEHVFCPICEKVTTHIYIVLNEAGQAT
jgi:uncharacterized protein YktB (UPF0637 family)